MGSVAKITVLLNDTEGFSDVRSKGPVRVVRRLEAISVDESSNVIVLVPATRLPEVAEFVREANKRHHLRALLVRADVEPRWVVHLLERANLRVLSNLIVHGEPDVPRRVLEAWRLGAQDELIADAGVTGDHLMVISCAMERYEIDFDDIPALARLPVEQRSEAKVCEDGSYIHWRTGDVHIDLETVRMIVDPSVRDRLRQERLLHDTRFGKAVALVRRSHNLTQNQIEGVSARQMRRVEKGSFPRTATLERMAASHGLSLKDYLQTLAQGMAEL